MKKSILFFLSLNFFVNQIESSNIDSTKEKFELSFLKNDIQLFINEIQEWYRNTTNDKNIKLFYEFSLDKKYRKKYRNNESLACLKHNTFSLVKEEIKIYSKRLAEYLIKMITNPNNIDALLATSKSLGYSQSKKSFKEYLTDSRKIQTGGGSGVGFQIYCGEEMLLTAGGGGGGGLTLTSKIVSSIGGGGGAGVNFYYPVFSHIGFGGGGGHKTYHSIIDNDILLWKDMDSSFLKLHHKINRCHKDGTLLLVGGGGGGGGGDSGREECSLGYKFSFSSKEIEPKNLHEDNQEQNEIKSQEHFGHKSPIVKAANICGGYKDWDCICHVMKNLYKEKKISAPWLAHLNCPHEELPEKEVNFCQSYERTCMDAQESEYCDALKTTNKFYCPNAKQITQLMNAKTNLYQNHSLLVSVLALSASVFVSLLLIIRKYYVKREYHPIY